MKIRDRLFIHITLSTCVLIVLFMFLFLRSMVNDEDARFQNKINLYSSMLPRLFSNAMYNLDDRMVDYLVNALEVDPEISSIEIKNERGEAILFHDKGAAGSSSLVENEMALSQDGLEVGTLTLRYTDALIQARIKQTVLFYLAMLAAMLSVVGGIVFWTSFSITRPLYQIIDLVRKISAGERDGEESIDARGELAVLLNAIRSMRTQIAEREASILKVKEEVFAHELEIKLGKQQLELEREAHQKTEALRSELQVTLDDLKQTQQQLVMSEKMASLGGLVAGISHEINTPIGNSLVTASFLGDQSREFLALVSSGSMKRSQLEEYLRTISSSTELINTNLQRAADLIRSFKQVSVDQTSDAEREFNLNEYLGSVVKSMYHQFKRTAYQINIDCPNDFEISSYPGAISQIVTNFVMNSLKHGFRDRAEGTIVIRARRIDSSSLEIMYSDDGHGIDAETLLHHFEPFYTTMRNNGGSGLGVYVVYNLVTQRLKGSIHVESAPDKGVVYILQFPVKFIDRDSGS